MALNFITGNKERVQVNSNWVFGNKGLAEYLGGVSILTALNFRKKYHLTAYVLTNKSIYFLKKDIDRIIKVNSIKK